MADQTPNGLVADDPVTVSVTVPRAVAERYASGEWMEVGDPGFHAGINALGAAARAALLPPASDPETDRVRAAVGQLRVDAELAALHAYIAQVDAYFHEHGWESLGLLDARRAVAPHVEAWMRGEGS